MYSKPNAAADRDAGLFHARGGERREANDVARSQDVRATRAIAMVDIYVAPVVGRDTDPLQREALGVASPSGGEKQVFAFERRAIGQRRHDSRTLAFDARPTPALHEADAKGLHGLAEASDDLDVEEREDRPALIDQRHLDPKRREHARILAADHTAPEDSDRLRQAIDAEDGVAIPDVCVIEIDLNGTVGSRAGGDQEVIGRERGATFSAVDHHRFRVLEVTLSAEVGYGVTLEVMHHSARLRLGDCVLTLDQLGDCGLGVELDRDSIEPPGAVSGEVERGFAQGLARESAGVDGRAARLRLRLDDRHALVEERRLDRALLTGRTGADYDQVEARGRRDSRHPGDITPGGQRLLWMATAGLALHRRERGHHSNRHR